MMLSSTIRTLIGGTAPGWPLSIPAGREGCSPFVFLLFFPLGAGRGDETRAGGGGVAVRWIKRPSDGWGAGGVGSGGAAGGAVELSEALE